MVMIVFKIFILERCLLYLLADLMTQMNFKKCNIFSHQECKLNEISRYKLNLYKKKKKEED